MVRACAPYRGLLGGATASRSHGYGRGGLPARPWHELLGAAKLGGRRLHQPPKGLEIASNPFETSRFRPFSAVSAAFRWSSRRFALDFAAFGAAKRRSKAKTGGLAEPRAPQGARSGVLPPAPEVRRPGALLFRAGEEWRPLFGHLEAVRH